MRLALIAVVLAPCALAQPSDAPAPPLAAPAEPVAADSLAADSLAARPLAADARGFADLFAAAAPSDQAWAQGVPRALAPFVFVYGSGLRVTLPPGWSGPATETGGVGDAVYAFENATAGHPLAGATIRVEYAAGLNELLRERWLRGQTTRGYHGTAPVGPLAAPVTGFGVEVAGPGRAGAAVFSRGRGGLWAVQVAAPTATWEGRRAEVLALLSGVDVP